MAIPESQGGLDYPDGGFASGNQLYAVKGDLAEQAVRLGAIPSVDRQGNVLLAYDFRYGDGVTGTDTAGLGEATGIYSDHSFYGGYSLKLNRVADTDSWSGFFAGVPVRQLGNSGAEVIFRIVGNRPNLKLYIQRYTDTQLKQGGLRWDTSDGKVYIGSDSQGWTETGNVITAKANLYMLFSMKLVIDESNEEYVRAFVGGQTITLPEVDLKVGADVNEAKTYLVFYNGTGPTSAIDVYVDAFIITCNEPTRE